jgi:hypothetical protein
VKFHVQVMSDVVLREGVPTGVSNKAKPCVVPACIIPQQQFYPLNNRSLCFIDVKTRL